MGHEGQQVLLKYLRGFGWLGICSIIDKRVNDREQMNIQGEVMQVCLANFIQFLSNQSKIFKTCNQYFIIHISFNQKSWQNYIKNSHITTHSLYFTMNFLIHLCYYISVHMPIIQMTIAVRIILAFFFFGSSASILTSQYEKCQVTLRYTIYYIMGEEPWV